jgi:hypothetical protein
MSGRLSWQLVGDERIVRVSEDERPANAARWGLAVDPDAAEHDPALCDAGICDCSMCDFNRRARERDADALDALLVGRASADEL